MNEFPSYQPGVKCTHIGTHFRPHEDECGAMAFLKHHGDKIHPGIQEAIINKKIIFFDAGPVLPFGQTWQVLHKKGIVLIGVGNSPYDEHNLPEEIKDKECAATLVARALGIDQDIRYKRIIDEMLINDRNPGRKILNNSSALRAGHILFGKNVAGMKNVIECAIQPIEWQMMIQQKLFSDTRTDFEKNSRVLDVTYKNQQIKVVTIVSSDEQVATYAKIAERPNMIICLNKDNGHVYVSASTFINLGRVVRKIRIEELLSQGIEFDRNDVRLMEDGIFPGLETWHFQSEANCFMNGSLTAPRKKPTTLAFNKIVDIILKSLSNAQPSPKLAEVQGFTEVAQKISASK